MLHRDIAARNFLVTKHCVIKLSDFGRARYVLDDSYQASSSEMVSVKWSSPEVLMKSHYSTRSDVWSAAVVLWEILTLGQRPYSSLTAEQTAVYVLNGGRLDRPGNCQSEGLYRLMMGCWEHDPLDRPSAGELAERLYDEVFLDREHQQSGSSETVMTHSRLRHRLKSSSLSASLCQSSITTTTTTTSSQSTVTTTSTCGSYKCSLTSIGSSSAGRLIKKQRSQDTTTWTDLDVVDETVNTTPLSSSSSSSVRGHGHSRGQHGGGLVGSSSADDLISRADKIRQSSQNCQHQTLNHPAQPSRPSHQLLRLLLLLTMIDEDNDDDDDDDDVWFEAANPSRYC